MFRMPRLTEEKVADFPRYLRELAEAKRRRAPKTGEATALGMEKLADSVEHLDHELRSEAIVRINRMADLVEDEVADFITWMNTNLGDIFKEANDVAVAARRRKPKQEEVA